MLTELVDLLLHSDVYLQQLVATYGPWIYGILFAIVFAETGLVVTGNVAASSVDATVTEAGTAATAGLLDVNWTFAPMDGAAPVSRTVPNPIRPPTMIFGLTTRLLSSAASGMTT